MPEIVYRNRRAVTLENDTVRVTLTIEGGHIAELLHKLSGVNPLWTPPWPSIEPSAFDFRKHPEYGATTEATLLSGILGHNICLDTFGAPSKEEMAAGIGIHGEGPVVPYEVTESPNEITMTAHLKLASLRFTRTIRLESDATAVSIAEIIENLSATDRPIAWTQHVTLGAPFIEPGQTQFRISATRSRVGDASFNDGEGRQQPGVEFEWPDCPMKDGSTSDLRIYPAESVSGGFTTHLMDQSREDAFFMAWSPTTKVLCGYVWKRSDFPWLARWEENRMRIDPPWNGQTITCGMEFGVSPLVESRREMVARGSMFGVPAYRWVPARGSVKAEYRAFITTAEQIPEQPAI